MAESAEPKAWFEKPDGPPEEARAGEGRGPGPPPPMWIPTDPSEAISRYRRAAPWIIAVFGLMGAVILLAVPVSAFSEIEPTSRRTIVLASILALGGVAIAIIASAIALAPRSSITEPIEPRRSWFLKHFSARHAVEDAFARQEDAQAVALVSEEMKQRLVLHEKERNAVRLGFVGVMIGALAIGTAMGVMVWEFENPTTVFEIDRIHADTIRIEVDTRKIAAETVLIEAQVTNLNTATLLNEGELAVQAEQLTLELELLVIDIADTEANTLRLQAEAEAAPTVELLVAQLANLELAVETMLTQLEDLQSVNGRTISG